MSRFLIAARKRPQLELEECIGNYEFSVVPKSLFTVDGQPLFCMDKSKILHHIEDMDDSCSMVVNPAAGCEMNRAIVIDGMAVVNQITKTKEMKTCKVFKSCYFSFYLKEVPFLVTFSCYSLSDVGRKIANKKVVLVCLY